MLIQNLMHTSGVKFGTSGARGLVLDMTDKVCYLYTKGFLQYLKSINAWQEGQAVVMGGDLRASSPRILAACMAACRDSSAPIIFAGYIPTPAVALYGFTHGIASLMVTGSHIPDDRNGIKFNTPTGEILKKDELGIANQTVLMDEMLFDDKGMLLDAFDLPKINLEPATNYIGRYQKFFGAHALSGMNIGVYQHSTVGRDIFIDIIEALGAQATPLARAAAFIPVDTEAIRSEDTALAQQWSSEHGFDAIISADGDADRPLISDEFGVWLKGDIAGILCARYLGCQHVVTPVSSNTAVEKSSAFRSVSRTQIGSPFVIAQMNHLLGQGLTGVCGYEANGGFLLGSDVNTLKNLPTRDAMIPILSILAQAKSHSCTVSQLVQELPARFTASDRIQAMPSEISIQKINELAHSQPFTRFFADISGQVKAMDKTDGLRFTFANDEVIHLRASGNAPELRCYCEADSDVRAQTINHTTMQLLEHWKQA